MEEIDPSPLIASLAKIADAKMDKPYNDVMDLLDDLLCEFDLTFVKDWSIACAMHFVQSEVIAKGETLDSGDIRKFVIPALVQVWNIDYADAIAMNRLVLAISIHIWGHGIIGTPKVLSCPSEREILLLAQLAVALSTRVALGAGSEHYGDPLRQIATAMA